MWKDKAIQIAQAVKAGTAHVFISERSVGEAMDAPAPDYDITPLRDTVYSIISKSAKPLRDRTLTLEEKFRLHLKDKQDSEWREVLEGLEYLDEKRKDLFTSYSSNHCVNTALEAQLERALAYFVYRHCGKADSEYEFTLGLALSVFLYNLIASIAEKLKICDTDALIEVCRIVSEEIEYSEENTENLLFEF